MGSAQGVFIMCGDQPRSFSFGNQVSPSPIAFANQASLPLYKQSVYTAIQAIVTGVGAITATIAIQGSNDDNTGRGFTPSGANGPGFLVTTTTTSTTVNSTSNQFSSALVGATVSAPGVPVGTTVVSVASTGASLVLSAAATATGTVQASIFANNWIATAVGTITLSGTTNVTDGFQTITSWRYLRANVTNVTGTAALVSVLMGV